MGHDRRPLRIGAPAMSLPTTPASRSGFEESTLKAGRHAAFSLLHPMRLISFLLVIASVTTLALAASAPAPATSAPQSDQAPILFNTAFESGSLGKIEKLGETDFRLHVKGQQD